MGKVTVLPIIMPSSLNCSLSQYLNHHIIWRLLQSSFPVLFHTAKVRTDLLQLGIALHIFCVCPEVQFMCYSVAFECSLHHLFLERFECNQ